VPTFATRAVYGARRGAPTPRGSFAEQETPRPERTSGLLGDRRPAVQHNRVVIAVALSLLAYAGAAAALLWRRR